MPVNNKGEFEYPQEGEGWSTGFIKRKGDPQGLITPGTLKLPEGEAMRTIRIEENGQHTLIPTMIDGKVLPEDKAIAQFRKSKLHLGVFESQDYADKYAQELNKAGRKARDYLSESPASKNVEDRRGDPEWQKSQSRMPKGPQGKW